MRVLVCGGRKYWNKEKVRGVLDTLLKSTAIKSVVHGAATGVDSLAGEWARKNNITEERFPADWKQGKKAGPIRNQQMIDTNPDLVIAFPGGKGTEDLVMRAWSKGITVLLPCKEEEEDESL